MNHRTPRHDRREALQFGTAALGAALVGRTVSADDSQENPPTEYAAFIKFVQDLPYDEMAQRLAAMGFTGVEATVRRKGIVAPERVEDELPQFVEALRRHDLKVHIMASDVNGTDELSMRVLRTASKLGIPRYRMAYYRYTDQAPIRQQLAQIRPIVKDLAAVNRELGIQGLYQNHAGRNYVGGTIWDIEELFHPYSTDQLAIAFDIRHATAEAGISWPTLLQVAKPQLGAVYVKDFRWSGKRPENVPLGEGRVDRSFFKLLRAAEFSGPYSLHVEYLGDEGTDENMRALKKDLATLKDWVAKS